MSVAGEHVGSLAGRGGRHDGRVAAETLRRGVRQNQCVTSVDDEPLARVSRPRVTLIGRPGCHLCEDAERVVAAVCAEAGEEFESLSILDDPLLAGRYAEEIPVVLVDGRQWGFFRVDADRLRSTLSDNRT